MQTNRPWEFAVSLLWGLWFVMGGAAQAPQSIPNGLPPWAYNIPDKVQLPIAAATGTVHLPGSKEYDPAKTASNTTPPDWFPDEHGPLPGIVAGAGGSTIPACGSCHLMSGQGHPESADIAALPVEYFVRQMDYFKSGARKDDGRMQAFARAASDEDVRQAAEYFAAIKPIAFVKVIETRTTYLPASERACAVLCPAIHQS